MSQPATSNDNELEAAAVWVDIDSLAPWDRNPRLIDDNQVQRVADSIKRFGFSAPIVARIQDREVIAGHTRLRAAKLLGLSRVPVRFLKLDPAEAHLLALADNRLTELTPWNESELHALLSEYPEVDASLAGWSSENLQELESSINPPADSGDKETAEDTIPEPPKDPVTRPGDIWQLGQHTLVCGDCRDLRTVQRLLGGERVNVTFTSPPYASQRKYDESSGFKPIPPDEYVAWFEAVQANVRAVLEPDGSWFVNIKEHAEDGQRSLYVKDLTLAHVRQWQWRLVDEFCWHKTAVPGSWPNRFRNAWEPVFHFSTQSDIRFRPKHVMHSSDRAVQGAGGTPKTAGGAWGIPDGWAREGGLALPENVLRIGTGGSESRHSAAFPVGLPGFFIRAFSDVGDFVLDPFMGSGTTIIACEQLERHGFGCELSPAYCDVIVERWQNLSGGKATRTPA